MNSNCLHEAGPVDYIQSLTVIVSWFTSQYFVRTGYTARYSGCMLGDVTSPSQQNYVRIISKENVWNRIRGMLHDGVSRITAHRTTSSTGSVVALRWFGTSPVQRSLRLHDRRHVSSSSSSFSSSSFGCWINCTLSTIFHSGLIQFIRKDEEN